MARKQIVPVGLNGSQYRRLKELSKVTGVPHSVFVRKAIVEWLDKYEAKYTAMFAEARKDN